MGGRSHRSFGYFFDPFAAGADAWVAGGGNAMAYGVISTGYFVLKAEIIWLGIWYQACAFCMCFGAVQKGLLPIFTTARYFCSGAVLWPVTVNV